MKAMITGSLPHLTCDTEVGADLVCSCFPFLSGLGNLCQNCPGCMHPVLVAAVSTVGVAYAVGARTCTAAWTGEYKRSGVGVVLGRFHVHILRYRAGTALLLATVRAVQARDE
jgi:hypothetical protein